MKEESKEKKPSRRKKIVPLDDKLIPPKKHPFKEIKLSKNKEQKEQESSESSETMNDLLSVGFDRYRQLVNDEYVELNQNVESLEGIVNEFLNDFLIVGHTVLGQRVVIRSAKNPRDYDALTDLMKRTIMKMFMEEQGGFMS